MIEDRKKCLSCGKFFLSFQGKFLHPEVPCSGLRDSISIEATIDNDELQNKFEEIYGNPTISDYERVEMLEKEVQEIKEKWWYKWLK